MVFVSEFARLIFFHLAYAFVYSLPIERQCDGGTVTKREAGAAGTSQGPHLQLILMLSQCGRGGQFYPHEGVPLCKFRPLSNAISEEVMADRA